MSELDVLPCRTKDLPDEVVDKLIQSTQKLIVVRSQRAALLPDTKWPPTQKTLVVGFWNGSDNDRQAVRRIAPEWSQHANIQMQFADSPQNAQIRIEFNTFNDSLIGKQSVGAGAPKASMHLQAPSRIPEAQHRMRILHEFGHALGLIHEHQSPDAPFDWDMSALRRTFGPGTANNWNDQMIQRNIVQRFQISTRHHTTFDPLSIMIYTFPAFLTRNRVETHENSQLSALDIQFIRDEYPGAPESPDGGAGGGTVGPRPPAPPVELTVDGLPRLVQVQDRGQLNVFTFQAEDDDKYEISVQGSAEVVTSLFGPDSDVAQKGDSRGPSASIDFRLALPRGAYRLEVKHQESTDLGTYEVKVAT